MTETSEKPRLRGFGTFSQVATLLALLATFYTIVQASHGDEAAFRRDIENGLRREIDLSCQCCRDHTP